MSHFHFKMRKSPLYFPHIPKNWCICLLDLDIGRFSIALFVSIQLLWPSLVITCPKYSVQGKLHLFNWQASQTIQSVPEFFPGVLMLFKISTVNKNIVEIHLAKVSILAGQNCIHWSHKFFRRTLKPLNWFRPSGVEKAE